VQQELDGNVGPQCHKVLTFLRDVHTARTLTVPFLLLDERYSTVDARAELRQLDRSPQQIAKQHDQWAAAEILDRFLSWGEERGLSTLGNEQAEEALFNARWKHRP
jgi:RNase H-fold protein (predicted Holliday junction resolvase)